VDKLEKVLSELMNVEYDIKALCVVLKALEVYYEAAGTEELKAVICIVKNYVGSSLNQLANSITELDGYLTHQK